MSRIIVTILGLGFAVFVAIQFIRPAIPNTAATAELQAPPEVQQIFRTSCYDCHSNQTKLRWFDQIVPAYWLVAHDVKDGRAKLNFSEIGALPLAQQKGILYEALNQVQLGAMPLPDYTRLHPDAVVTPEQVSVIENYLNPPAAPQSESQTDASADDAQYQKWLHPEGTPHRVAPAPNGIEFPADYKNWKEISTTDRFDNQSVRVILGNDVAVQAIAENHINPWPDGTTFAKIAWAARDDGQGHERTGAFLQVEFMIRDRHKYAATKGWGWARWRGLDLTPYGKDAEFTDECIGCHTPVRDDDYVFTFPLQSQK
jgi:Haem-binding domain/Cytochrome P460